MAGGVVGVVMLGMCMIDVHLVVRRGIAGSRVIEEGVRKVAGLGMCLVDVHLVAPGERVEYWMVDEGVCGLGGEKVERCGGCRVETLYWVG